MLEQALAVNERVNHRLRRRARKSAREAAQALGESLRLTGIAGPVPRSIRAAFWTTAYGYRKGWANLLWCGAGVITLLVAANGIGRLARAALPSALPLLRFGAVLLVYVVILMVAMSALGNMMNTGWLGLGLKFSQVGILTTVVNRCGGVVAASPRTRADHLTRVSGDLRLAERAVLKLYRTRKTVPVFSHRRPQLKVHARLVVARLRVAEARFDIDAEAAAKELARLLVDIAENYGAGRVGALLPHEELQDLSPVRDRASAVRSMLSWPELGRALVMLGLLAVFTGAGMWAGSRLGLSPEIAATPALVIAGVLTQGLSFAVPRQSHR
ncbi:hypothetical protein ACWC5I_04805 [Kitasatospora sp. NPDC001574]